MVTWYNVWHKELFFEPLCFFTYVHEITSRFSRALLQCNVHNTTGLWKAAYSA